MRSPAELMLILRAFLNINIYSKFNMSELVTDECAINMSWAFTFKKLGNGYVLPKDYDQVIRVLNRYGYVDCHFYERDSSGKLHVHGIVQLRKGFMRKRLAIQGFHMHLVEIYERQGWEKYILKDEYLFDKKFEPSEPDQGVETRGGSEGLLQGVESRRESIQLDLANATITIPSDGYMFPIT